MIPFIQYLRPHGEQRPVTVKRSPEIEDLAWAIIRAGHRFEIEELTTGEVSMEIVRDVPTPDVEDSIAILICANGPTKEDILGVPEAIDRLVREAAETLKLTIPIEKQKV